MTIDRCARSDRMCWQRRQRRRLAAISISLQLKFQCRRRWSCHLACHSALSSQLTAHSSQRGAGHLIKRGMRRIQFVAVSVVVVVFVCSTRQLKLPAVLVERFLLFSFPRHPYLLNPSSPYLSLSPSLSIHTSSRVAKLAVKLQLHNSNCRSRMQISF